MEKKMKAEIIEDKDGVLEIEFDDKVLPNALLAVLMKTGVDAYADEPHPLLPDYRLHIEAKNPKKEFKDALKIVDSTWNEFAGEFKRKFKSTKKPKKSSKK